MVGMEQLLGKTQNFFQSSCCLKQLEHQRPCTDAKTPKAFSNVASHFPSTPGSRENTKGPNVLTEKEMPLLGSF